MPPGAQGRQERACGILLRDAKGCRTHPINADRIAGLIEDLTQGHVNGAGNLSESFLRLARQSKIARTLAADEADFEGCRRARGQRLAGCVRRLEECLNVRELLLQHCANRRLIIHAGTMVSVELNKDFAVGGAYRSRFHPGKIDRVRSADVFDDKLKFVRRNNLANLTLDVGHDTRGILHANAARNPHEEADQTGIRLREKLASGKPGGKGSETERNDHRNKNQDLPPQKKGENGSLQSDETVEPMLDRLIHSGKSPRGALGLPFLSAKFERENERRERWHERAGQHIAREHGKDDGESERTEDVGRGSREQEDRQEHDADGNRRDELRKGDLASTVENSGAYVLPQRNLPFDVLDLDERVIHEDADGESKSAERHQIECRARQVKPDDRAEQGERNRRENDERGAPGTQKQEHHGGDKTADKQNFVLHPFHGRTDEDRLVENRFDVHARRSGDANFREAGKDAIDDIHSGGIAEFQN